MFSLGVVFKVLICGVYFCCLPLPVMCFPLAFRVYFLVHICTVYLYRMVIVCTVFVVLVFSVFYVVFIALLHMQCLCILSTCTVYW